MSPFCSAKFSKGVFVILHKENCQWQVVKTIAVWVYG
jgi:hypothetical protein